MTNDIHLAFAHPSARAEAMDNADDPLDRISLRDHVVEVEIGAFQQERGTKQRLRFNVVVELRRNDQPIDDDVDRILSYDTITEAIATELAAERLNLLETLAERVAVRLLSEPQPVRVFVRIEKLDRGPGALGVEIVRRRDAAAKAQVAEVRPDAQVIFLSNDAIAAPDLKVLLDRVEATGIPAILCVGLPDVALARSGVGAAQRRINLLAIEQNAWVLAGRDARCIVTGTRTEIDWAIKHGQISVWAPSKIVLDAVEDPNAPSTDGAALAGWLAERFDAHRLVIVGEDVVQTYSGPILRVAPGADFGAAL